MSRNTMMKACQVMYSVSSIVLCSAAISREDQGYRIQYLKLNFCNALHTNICNLQNPVENIFRWLNKTA